MASGWEESRKGRRMLGQLGKGIGNGGKWGRKINGRERGVVERERKWG